MRFSIFIRVLHREICRSNYHGNSVVEGKKFAFNAEKVNIFKCGNYRRKLVVNILCATILNNIIVITCSL